MKRKHDWECALVATVEAAMRRPFSWGEHDCCLFAASCVSAMTGEDPMAEFRGAYDNEEGAKAALKALGAGTLYHTLLTKFGKPLHPSKAMRGDLLYCVLPSGPAIGVCLGADGAFVGAAETGDGVLVRDGIQMIPVTQTSKAFRI